MNTLALSHKETWRSLSFPKPTADAPSLLRFTLCDCAIIKAWVQLWHGGKTGSNGRVVLNDLSVGDGGCIVHPHLPRLPKTELAARFARILMAHLEHLEGKMMPGPPALQDKRCEVGKTSTQQERRWLA